MLYRANTIVSSRTVSFNSVTLFSDLDKLLDEWGSQVDFDCLSV